MVRWNRGYVCTVRLQDGRFVPWVGVGQPRGGGFPWEVRLPCVLLHAPRSVSRTPFQAPCSEAPSGRTVGSLSSTRATTLLPTPVPPPGNRAACYLVQWSEAREMALPLSRSSLSLLVRGSCGVELASLRGHLRGPWRSIPCLHSGGLGEGPSTAVFPVPAAIACQHLGWGGGRCLLLCRDAGFLPHLCTIRHAL